MKRTILTPLLALALGAICNAQAVLSAGTLTITQPNTDDAFTVEVGPANGLTRIYTATGIPDGIQFFGVSRIVIRTNGGADKVYVKVEAPTAPVLDIETGEGESEVDVDIKTSALGAQNSIVRIVGGAANDKAAIKLDTKATNALAMNWSVDGRGGQNEAQAYVWSDNRTTSATMNYTIVGGLGQDAALLDMSTRAASMAVNLRGSTGANSDRLEIRAKGDTFTTSSFNPIFDMGAGMDEAVIDFSDVFSTAATGSLNLGTESDALTALFGGDLSGSAAWSTGEGNDVAKIFADRFAGAVRILMGGGNDLTEVNSNRPALVLPFADGGLGIDHLKGRATNVGYELFN